MTTPAPDATPPAAGETASPVATERTSACRAHHAARFNTGNALMLCALALAGALLTLLPDGAALPMNLSVWAHVGLPAGLAVSAALRWDALRGTAVAVGLAVALSLDGLPVPAAGAVGALVALISWWTRNAMRRLDFDARLDRAGDVLRLAWALPLLAGLPLALVLQAGLPLLSLAGSGHWAAASRPAAGGLAHSADLAADLYTVSLALLCMATAVLAWRKGAWGSGRRGSAAPGQGGLALLMLTPWLLLYGLASAVQPSAALLALLVAPVVLVLLSLRGQLAVAATGLVLVAALAGAQAGAAGLLWQLTPGGAGVGIWVAANLAAVLIGHAASVYWRDRALRWEWALDGSRMGVAVWHLQHGHPFVSDAWRHLAGPSQEPWHPQDWLNQVHPEDQPGLAAALAALTAGTDGRRTLELRMRSDDGWCWREATLLVMQRRPDGQPLRLLATLADVQQRRLALEQQRLSGYVFQHLHEGLLITDGNLLVLDANPAYSQITGVPREELLGQVPSLLQPQAADPLARQQRAEMWTGLHSQGSWRGELTERRRSGEFCTLQATISTVRGPEQDLRHHVLVISDITQQQQQREQLERQAHFDDLTRLPNRARLSKLLDDAMQAADQAGHLLVVAYLDLDRFKPVNDRLGHAAGDQLLVQLAGRLRSALRGRPGGDDSAARLGGDEFALLLRAGTLEEARLAVERVLRLVSQPYAIVPGVDPVQVTASLGATVYPIDRSDAETLLRHADHAMYSAKQSGRNGYYFFDPEHRRRTEERVTAIGRVQEALDRQEFVLHYQPKVDMRSGRVLGLEALLRWEHPQQGLIAPLQFLPLIENTGLSSRIGDWVIAQALDHLAQWQRDGLDLSVSVNVSARHLQEPDFALRLSELLARHAEPLAQRLEIEMLETAAHADIEATSALLARCQGIGVRFALDDFGTGYSTLNYLKQLPVDVLKIDQSFVQHMLDDAQDRAIVEGVIGLARTFHCTVVAEGVENPAQARTLLDLGCDIGQGTGIAAPMPADQVGPWVRGYKGMFALVTAAAPSPAPEGGVARLSP